MSIKKNTVLTEYFDKTYIINLPDRTDRLKELEEQFHNIDLSINHPKIKVFPAVRPSDPGEFENIGARGCFLSHLGVLNDAKENGYERILILEDDVNFSNNFTMSITQVLDFLRNNSWNIFYGGHRLGLENKDENLVKIPSEDGIMTAHFIAFQGKAINTMIHELTLMLNRKNGDSKGGPMHVDGAYSVIRKNYPTFITYAANPAMCYQRASRTDIHQNRWFDTLPAIKQIVSFLRKLKNKFIS